MLPAERTRLLPPDAFSVDLPHDHPRMEALLALRVLSMPRKLEREILWSYFKNGDRDKKMVRGIIERAFARTARKVAGIGLSPKGYFDALTAFAEGDTETLVSLSRRGDTTIAMRKETIQAAIDQQQADSSDSTIDFEPIIEDAFTGKNPSKSPHLFVIAGPTGAGKTSVRRQYEHMFGDIVIADPDRIRHQLIDDYDPTNNAHVQATHDLSYALADEIAKRAIEQGYNFAFETTLRAPLGYKEGDFGVKPAILKARETGYQIHATYVFADLADCFRRAVLRDENRAVPLSTVLSTPVGLNNFSDIIREFNLNPMIVDNTAHGEHAHEFLPGIAEFELRKGYYADFHGLPLNIPPLVPNQFVPRA